MSGIISEIEQIRQRKKGVRNANDYAKENLKKSRSLGNEYVTSIGTGVPAKRPGPSYR